MRPLDEDELSGALSRRVLVPLLVLLLGVALTTAAALVSQASAEREQELLFGSAVLAEQQNFENRLDSWTGEFDSAVSFIGATFPASPEEFHAFFEDTLMGSVTSPIDPGISFVELVEPEEVAAVEAREAAFGRSDFRVSSLGSGDETMLVVTRTSQEPAPGRLSFIGRDLRPLVGEEFVESLSSPRRFLFVVDETDGLTNFGSTEGEFGFPVSVLVEQIFDMGTGEQIGWVSRSFDVDAVLNDTVAHSDAEANLRVEFLGEVVDVIDVSPQSNLSFEDATLSEQVVVSRGDLEFTVSMWGDDDFGVPTGLADQSQIWLLGLIVTMAVFAAAVLWITQQHLLANQSFELDHARTLARTDPLTGLLNRNGLIEAAEQSDLALGGTVFFIDLDGFKSVNDTFGHSEGDAVLRSVAQVIRTQFRNADLVSRFGGDEFMVFTPGLYGSESEVEVAERVVDAIKQAVLDVGSGSETEGSNEYDITCSIGAAGREPFELTPVETLIRKADRAMYRAKEAGGNRFEGAKPS